MNDNVVNNTLVNIEIPENATDLAQDVYSDVAKPASKELGDAAGTIVGLINTILTPVKMLNAIAKINADNFIKEYENKVALIPTHKRFEPNPALIGPMAEHAKYKITEETLKHHYLNLMASASNADNLCKPLLSFDNVLNQLTPVEIKILKHLFLPFLGKNHCLAEIRKRTNGAKGYTVIFSTLTNINFENLQPDEISTILSNFERLGLIRIDKNTHLVPKEQHYSYVESSPLYKSFQKNCSTNEQIEYHGGHFTTTAFGQSFISTIFI